MDTSGCVNDLHSGLNSARPAALCAPREIDGIRTALAQARRERLGVAVCGGRHAMGGQQFVDAGLQIDMSAMTRVLEFDPARGLLRAQAGLQWPALMAWLDGSTDNADANWGIRQKQTGADRFSLGGCLSANVHGRGLALPPFVADIEAFTLIAADREICVCSRESNTELFGLAIGGYGLFGIVADLTLRLARRRKLRREVELTTAQTLCARLQQRRDEGCLYGDFQFEIDAASPGFLRHGILSCYREVDAATPLTADPIHLSGADWHRLLHLAHIDKSRAFAEFAAFYQRSHGQVYRSDDHQAGYYLDEYHAKLDPLLGHRGSEVITELYVPRPRLAHFLEEAGETLRRHRADVVYGTVRLVEADRETFLAWAREAFACVILNLHTPHDEAGKTHSAAAFRALIDLALRHGGSFYLTYHRHATRVQLEAAYPQFAAFLAAKRRHDPDLLLQSDWYRHYRSLFETP